MRSIFGSLSLIVTLSLGTVSGPAHALSLSDLTNKDASAGLKEALTKGAQVAVQKLGAENGFFGNDKVKIPLPESMQKVDSLMRNFGMGKQADELLLRMNRAAEAAVPEARTLLVNAVKQMSVEDAKGILSGGNDAATQYFKRTTSEPMAGKFLPIVKKAMEKVKLAEVYNNYADQGAKYGLVKAEDARIENYITRKALDGVFVMIAEEEKAIRADPVGQTSNLLKKVFGALGK
jgi:hypothetical protein